MARVSERRLSCGVRGEPQYLTGMDLFSAHQGVAAVLAYPGGLDVEALERSLVATLEKYPLLTGRIRRDAEGHDYVDCNDAGVGFAVEAHEGKLPPYGLDRPVGDDIGRFHRTILPWRVVDRDQPLLTVVVHTFEDGGALLSVSFVHSIFDGSSFWTFMNDWSMVHRGEEIAAPSLDRNAVIARCREHRGAPYTLGLIRATSLLARLWVFLCFAFQHLVTHERFMFRVRREDVRRLCESDDDAAPAGKPASPSAVIVAHCLKLLSSRMRSRRDRRVGMVADLRYRRDLGFPRRYVGSAVGQSEAVFSRDELEREGVTALARSLATASEGASTEQLSAYMAFMEGHRQRRSIGTLFGKCLLETPRAGVLVNNALAFPIYRLDFGTGRPSWYEIPRHPFRYVILLPSPAMDGSVDVFVTAPRHELARFKERYGAARDAQALEATPELR